jgi:hypothetical protein
MSFYVLILHFTNLLIFSAIQYIFSGYLPIPVFYISAILRIYPYTSSPTMCLVSAS